MKELFEDTISFEKLDDIPRSKMQKDRSFKKIMEAAEPGRLGKKQVRQFPWVKGPLLTAAAFFVAAVYFYSQFSIPDQDSTFAELKELPIADVITAETDSEYSYITNGVNIELNESSYAENPFMKAMIRSMLHESAPTNYTPAEKPSYDALIRFKGGDTLQLKLWNVNEVIYFREESSKEFFKAPDKLSRSIFKTLKKEGFSWKKAG
ncbi:MULTISPECIES: hypothetical protein [Bacillus]|uniref:hypothetical protein n=1 Tax=Bacillus TaxID=1386 RepID=UPI000C761E40|nr:MULTISPECIES: hypothetical protein [Bacillus]PLR71609.1 hypothetical protein CYJ37_17150 [Bacillus sp. UMB0728]RYI32402.1 hypothetical protein EVU96_02030 [Bacillus infantis]